MGTNGNYAELQNAADAARVTLVKLERERDELNKKLADLVQPINMLKNVVSAWEAIDPNRGVQATLPQIPSEVLVQVDESARAPRGEVGARVDQVMADGIARSKKEVLAEIKRRFNVDDNVNSVAMALTRRANRGALVVVENGKFQLAL